MIADFKLVNDTTFSLNGIEYKRVFIPKKVSNTGLKVVCAYDSINVIQDNIPFTDVIVDGFNHKTLSQTMSVLKDLLFTLNNVGAGGGKDLGKVKFADKGGDVKYVSDIDKKTGYYDIENEVYYPELRVVTNNDKYSGFSVLNPSNLFVTQYVSTGSSSVDRHDYPGFSFDLINAEEISISGSATFKGVDGKAIGVFNFSGTIHNSLKWTNVSANCVFSHINETNNSVIFGKGVNSKPFVGFRVQENLKEQEAVIMSVDYLHLQVKKKNTNFRITDFYNSLVAVWDLNGIGAFESGNVQAKIEGDELIPQGKIKVYDKNGAEQWSSNKLQFGEGFNFDVTKNEVNYKRLNTLDAVPTSSTDTGKKGEVRYTVDYIYVCVATNTWKRTPLITW